MRHADRTAPRLVDLADEACLDLRLVGAKAAGLAKARAVGLPVLPGVVVTVEQGRRALVEGAAALSAGGSGAARLTVMAIEPAARVLDELRAQACVRTGPVIVRSSSTLETDGCWAGAFSTFEDVSPDELSTAIRGVWASVFRVDTLERLETAGIGPLDAAMAVLVQPQIRPSCGGIAAVRADGTVDVTATERRLAALTAGWDSGVRAVVTSAGTVHGTVAPFPPEVYVGAAALARDARALLGDETVEWALVRGEPVLLQSSRSGAARASTWAVPSQDLDSPVALALALGAAQCSGGLGEALVLPWWTATDRPIERSGVSPSANPLADLEMAMKLAAELIAQAWPLGGAAEAQTALRAVRGDSARPALDRLAALPSVPAAKGERVLAMLDAVVAAAVTAGLARHSHAVWRGDPDHVQAWLAGTAPPPPAILGPDRWEPFVHAALMAAGSVVRGTPAVPGVGAGRAVVVADPHAPPSAGGRPVVVVSMPVPAIAPMLWGAAGLVTTGGNQGAHLIEVARSLGVPAVVGARLDEAGFWPAGLTARGAVIAVDGGRGTIAVAM